MPADKEVTRVDQDKINLFSRMNQRMTDIDASIATRKKTVTDIEDANEIVENLQIVEEDAPGKEITKIFKAESSAQKIHETIKYRGNSKSIAEMELFWRYILVYFRIGECFMLQTCEDIGDMIGKFRYISITFH